MSTIPWPAWASPARSAETVPWRRALARFFHAFEVPSAVAEHAAGAAARARAQHFLISRECDGRWRVESGGAAGAPSFPLLSEAIVFARGTCEAAPATIELRIGEVTAVVHQDAGWPRAICRAAAHGLRPAKGAPRA